MLVHIPSMAYHWKLREMYHLRLCVRVLRVLFLLIYSFTFPLRSVEATPAPAKKRAKKQARSAGARSEERERERKEGEEVVVRRGTVFVHLDI